MTPQQFVQQRTAASGSSFYYAFLFLPSDQRLGDRVAGLARIGLAHFCPPPGQLGGRDARLVHLIHHVVDLAAEGIEGRDGLALIGGQKQERAASRLTASISRLKPIQNTGIRNSKSPALAKRKYCGAELSEV